MPPTSLGMHQGQDNWPWS